MGKKHDDDAAAATTTTKATTESIKSSPSSFVPNEKESSEDDDDSNNNGTVAAAADDDDADAKDEEDEWSEPMMIVNADDADDDDDEPHSDDGDETKTADEGGRKRKRKRRIVVTTTTNGTRVNFTGSLIPASGKSLGSEVSEIATSDDDDDNDIFNNNNIAHAPMYPNYSSRHLTKTFSKRENNYYSLVDEKGGHNNSNHHRSFLDDDPKEMTLSRRLALKLLDKKWYNPNAGKPTDDDDDDDDDVEGSFYDGAGSAGSGSAGGFITSGLAPSLKRAWAYFEHVTLMRYFVMEGRNRNAFEMSLWERFRYASTHRDEDFENAMPGEIRRPTRLYDYLATPHMQLGDFGLGFGLYFSTLRAIGYILFIAGLMSTFNIYFFASGQYSNLDFDYNGVENLLRCVLCVQYDDDDANSWLTVLSSSLYYWLLYKNNNSNSLLSTTLDSTTTTTTTITTKKGDLLFVQIGIGYHASIAVVMILFRVGKEPQDARKGQFRRQEEKVKKLLPLFSRIDV
eukprot:scaffold774_cov75-Cylindrotheca_fusiformis.AAC.5